ncbi:phage tail protein [Novosphingobium sp. TH158]|uniref:phage tail protein n=1 Tax=Novosphingobium sp. TH158 TaxID=2067455 RepID=UPI000C7AA0CF|nr:phage tail protein [Novosphingobium sp. TH158]PLK27419.1 hypothetical protein C0V78_11365 [Novosphingobium sp. TH158]
MATLLFTALGSLFGGPIAGALGALVGRQLDRAIIGTPGREGPRLKELSVTTSSYGTPIPRVHGRMRVPGTIIWATDLVEHRDKQGGGKGKPSYTTYSYSASLAVALSSRPLQGIGRIWADGNLLRGAAGDMKAGGEIRFYNGFGDQPVDPLLVAAEGAGECPAYRGLSYVVFEDLQLGDFGNRIPALTFEVFTSEGELTVSSLLDGVIDDVSGNLPLEGVEGISCEGPLADLLGQMDAVFPLDCDVSGDRLSLGREGASPVRALSDATISVADDAFGAQQGFSRKRLPQPSSRPEILRYYDVDRDYQPGLQRAPGRPAAGQPATIDLPVAIAAGNARSLISRTAQRAGWARQSLSWRTAELDPAIAPGSLVTIPGEPGVWRVEEWEWRESGLELGLWRAPAIAPALVGGDSGRLNPPLDQPVGETILQAFELPWDGNGPGDSPLLYAAVSSPAAGWPGAALFADQGDGQLQPLGASGRTRATIGEVLGVLSPSSPHVFDRNSQIEVRLASPTMALSSADARALAFGANRALLCSEIVQFAGAVSLGNGHWRLSGFLRGRGGTEAVIAGHGVNERFVLLDGTQVPLDPGIVGDLAGVTIAALGLGESQPVISQIACRGITRRPLSPVHPRMASDGSGGLVLRWTRRARGAWGWPDGVDLPLNEETESYQVVYESAGVALAAWTVFEPRIEIAASLLASLVEASPAGNFAVRQQGRHGLSEPLLFAATA